MLHFLIVAIIDLDVSPIENEETIIPKPVKPITFSSVKSLDQAKQIESMFDDDDAVVIQCNFVFIQEIQIEITNENEMHVDKSKNVCNVSVNCEKIENDDHIVTAPKKVRKRRKIHKTVNVMEGKYMKTMDVSEWESYSDDESAAPVRKIAKQMTLIQQPKSKKNSKTAPKMVQKSMLSFFTKIPKKD
jgi:hypothetical protein